MGTGGGWQDQAAGWWVAYKLVASAAGNRQTVCMEPLSVPDGFLDELNRRFCLVYSGQRRLGRTVLREMMGGYIRRDPVFLKAMDDIHSLAFDMKANIEAGCMPGFIDNINRQTQLTKSMDTGYINPRVGRILDAMQGFDGRCHDLRCRWRRIFADILIPGIHKAGFEQSSRKEFPSTRH
jgi:fucokinase